MPVRPISSKSYIFSNTITYSGGIVTTLLANVGRRASGSLILTKFLWWSRGVSPQASGMCCSNVRTERLLLQPSL